MTEHGLDKFSAWNRRIWVDAGHPARYNFVGFRGVMMPDKPNAKHQTRSNSEPRGIVKSLVRSRIQRITGPGAQGIYISSMGIALAVFVALGYAAGHWLDGRQRTDFWTPILSLLGAAAGFWEMFKAIRTLNAAAMREQNERIARRNQDLSTAGGFERPKGVPLAPVKTVTKRSGDERPRSFKIPEPPTSSFDEVGQPIEETEKAGNAENDISTLTKRLLNENDPNSLSS